MKLEDHKEALSILFIGFVWGITNPFLRKGTEEAEEAMRRDRRKNGDNDGDEEEHVISIVGSPQCTSSAAADNTKADQNQIQPPPADANKKRCYRYCSFCRPQETNSMSTSSSPGYEEISLTSDLFSYGSIGKDDEKDNGGRRPSYHSISSFFKEDEISLASLPMSHVHLHEKDRPPSPTLLDITPSEQQSQLLRNKKTTGNGRLRTLTAKLKLGLKLELEPKPSPLTTSGGLEHGLTEMIDHHPTPTETTKIPSSIPIPQVLQKPETPPSEQTFLQGTIHTLLKFKNPAVFIPFLLNQTSGLCYYKLIATTTLTNAAYCNALSMIFSAFTGHFLGERLDAPVLACGGSILVVLGVAICMMSKELQEEFVTLFFNRDIAEGVGGTEMGTGILGGLHNHTLNINAVNISVASATATSSDYIGSDLTEAASGIIHTLLSSSSSLFLEL